MMMLWLSLEVSRPGFWFITVWLYIAACGGHHALLGSPRFWLGLLYVTYPLNLLTYSWNDLGDGKLDAMNPRKGNYLLGTKHVDDDTLKKLRNTAIAFNIAFFAYFAIALDSYFQAASMLFIVLASNFFYNQGPTFRNGPMPMDLFMPLGYTFILWFATWLNDLPPVPLNTWAFHFFMVLRSQLWGQIIDFNCDSQAGRMTTAVNLGITHARRLLLLLVAMELASAVNFPDNRYVSVFSALSFTQALVELCFYPPKGPTLLQSALTGLVITPAAGLLLLQVWHSGIFSGR